MAKFTDLVGQKFGRWVVLENVGKGKWLCRCECGTERVVLATHLNSGKTKSCGCLRKQLCHERTGKNHPMYGKCHTEEAKRKNSESQKGVKSHWYGKHHTEEWKKQHSERMTGEKHPNYNPNLTDEERHQLRNTSEDVMWSKQVKINADFTCDCCHKRGGELCSHHLKDWHSNKELRLDLNNGVCLCVECHKEFHNSYMGGYRIPCNEEDYKNFKEIKQNNDNKGE